MSEAIIVTDSPSTVQLVRETPKSLHIAFVDDAPQFVFQGHWTGKNVTTVSRLLLRMYKRYIREIRLEERRNRQ